MALSVVLTITDDKAAKVYAPVIKIINKNCWHFSYFVIKKIDVLNKDETKLFQIHKMCMSDWDN